MDSSVLDNLDTDYILCQLEKLESGQVKKESMETYSSRALNSKNKDLQRYLSCQIIKSMYKYRRLNGVGE